MRCSESVRKQIRYRVNSRYEMLRDFPPSINTETTMSTVVDGVIPEDIVANASNIEVFDSKGTKKTFGELIAATKTIVVFIRKCFMNTSF